MSTDNPVRLTRLRWRRGAGTATRSKAVAGLTALLLPLAAMVGLASPAEAATSATASYVKKSDWGTGFEGQWTVKNTGTTALSSWTIEWDFPSGTAVGSAWDASVTSSGTHWTAKNLGWNGTVAPGASISFGFNGTGSGSPSGCKLNGASCDGGSVPGDNPPSKPGTPTASNVTDTSAKISWTAATDDKGVKNYDVLRDGAKVATVTTTTYTDSGLTKGTDYSYTVQARDTADQTGPVSASVAVRTTGTTDPGNPGTGDKINLGYFTEWGVYGRNYHVKNLVTSGSAAKITHINYAFGNVQNGRCTIGDSYADYDKAYTADQSVDGVADTWDQPLRGNFNQLRKLKAKYPHIKVLWSFGGWTWSGGFPQAAQNPAALRPVLLRPGRGPPLGRCLRRHRHRLGVPERLRSHLRHERPGSAEERRLRPAGEVRHRQPGHRRDHRGRLGGRQDRRGRLRRRRPVHELVQRDDVRLLRRLRTEGPDGPALTADLVLRHPAGGLQLRRRHRQAEGPGRPGLQAAPRHRLLRPRLDRRHPVRSGRHRHRRGPGHLRGRQRGLQGPEEHLPRHRHDRRHRVRALRHELVELRHPGDDHVQDGLGEQPGPGWRVLLGVQRRHRQR
ncbi:hypothetical protein RKD45_004760 [Streptomyces griseus]